MYPCVTSRFCLLAQAPTQEEGVVSKKDLGAPASNTNPPMKIFAPKWIWTKFDENQ
jgi:hypothetical protein